MKRQPVEAAERAPRPARTAGGQIAPRLLLDALSAALLLVGFGYHWLGNVPHEIAGTALFVLVVGHNVINRRRYRAVARPGRVPRAWLNAASIVALIAAVLTLVVTSLMISRFVFAALGLEGGFEARQFHAFAAYWALIVVSIHVGLRWPLVMAAARDLLGIATGSVVRTLVLRALAALLVVLGIRSSFEIGVGAKLTLEITMSFWDFEASTLPFFLHHIAIGGLYAVLTYYGAAALQRMRTGPRDRPPVSA